MALPLPTQPASFNPSNCTQFFFDFQVYLHRFEKDCGRLLFGEAVQAGGSFKKDKYTPLAHADEVVRSIECYGSAAVDMKSWAEQQRDETSIA